MNLKWHWFAGIAAVFVYVCAVIIGGLLYPGYSHISQDISQLTSTNSPIRELMNIFFFYNFLVAFFGCGLFRLSKNKFSRIGACSVILIGVLGFIIGWFPINTRGTEITDTGIVHLTIVSIISVLTVINGFLFWFAYKKTELRFFARISLYSGVGFLISGPIAGVLVLSPYAGLAERIPIGIFLGWILVTSLIMLRSNWNS